MPKSARAKSLRSRLGVGKFLRIVIQAAVIPESHDAAMLDADEYFHLALHAASVGQAFLGAYRHTSS